MGGGRLVEAFGVLSLLAGGLAACSAGPADDEQQVTVKQQINEARSVSRSSRWQLLGGDLNPFPGQFVSRPSLVGDSPAGPVVAFSSVDPATSDGRVFVLRWRHGAWTSVGEPFDGKGPALAANERGGLYVCFAPPASAAVGGPLVQRWTSGAWVAVGGDVGAETGYEGQRYVLDTCDGLQVRDHQAPIVAWAAERGPMNFRVYAGEWQRANGQWVGLGPGAIGARPTFVSLAVGARDRVFVATFTPDGSYGGGATTQVWSWDGTAWNQLGADMPATADPVIGLDHGPPILVFQNLASKTLMVMRWTNGAWASLPSPGLGAAPALAFTSSGKPVIAFVDLAASPTIRVVTLAHGGWRELDGGVAPAGDGQVQLAIALDDQDRPTVAWSRYDIGTGSSSIFVARQETCLR